jgi:hypothetical protein
VICTRGLPISSFMGVALTVGTDPELTASLCWSFQSLGVVLVNAFAMTGSAGSYLTTTYSRIKYLTRLSSEALVPVVWPLTMSCPMNEHN